MELKKKENCHDCQLLLFGREFSKTFFSINEYTCGYNMIVPHEPIFFTNTNSHYYIMVGPGIYNIYIHCTSR